MRNEFLRSVANWISGLVGSRFDNQRSSNSRSCRRINRLHSKPTFETLEIRQLLTIGPETTTWLEGSQNEFAQIISGANVAAGPTKTWTGNTTPILGDVQKTGYSSIWVYVQQNPDLASYVMGPWFNANGSVFPNLPTNQNMIFRIPRVPVQATTHSATGLGEIGLYLNGVAMFNSLDGFSYNNASGTDKSSMGPPGQTGDGIWQRNANYAEEATFDHAHGHQPGNGEYHYHENPTALRAQLNDNIEFTNTTNYFPYETVLTGTNTHSGDEDRNYEEIASGFHHSSILGWARDGYPVYGPYGFSNPTDSACPVVRMVPNYQLRNITQRHSLDDWAARLHFGNNVTLNTQGQYDLTTTQWGPNVSTQFPLGAYIEDYETVAGLGTLDVYNGRFAKTPEYPNGTYAYYATVDALGEGMFPYGVGPQYNGTATGGRVTSITETITACFDIAVGNTAPTISDIPNQSANMGTSLGPIAFTIGDAQTATTELLITVSSSNSALLANLAIVLGGTTANRTLTATPTANAIGTTTVTVTVTDCAGATATDTFILTVAAANNNPTISNISDQTTNEDTSTGAIAFTIGDVETPVANLTVSGSSSNTALVPNANIVFGGSGANRTVTVTPAANQNGSAIITVTVTDANGASANDTFVLTVTPVNDPPTISDISDQSVNEDTSTGAIPFTVGDVETLVANLTVSGSSSNTALVPNTNVVFSGSGANRTVTLTPVAGQSGSAVITLSVSDSNGGTANDTFVLTVSINNHAPTITPITDQTVDEDNPTSALPFSIADIETPTSDLIVSGSSSNAALVPNANIVFSGSGANRTLTVAPTADQNSSTIISVKVSDGSKSVSTQFRLNVQAVNDSPVLANPIPDQALTEDQAFDFTLADNTFKDVDLNDVLTLRAKLLDGRELPNWLTFSNATRRFTGTPLNEDVGAFEVVVTATDTSNASASDTFRLDIANTNDAPSNIVLTANTVSENAAGATIGSVSATDPDVGDTVTLSVSDNRFEVIAGLLKLKAGQSLDFETASNIILSLIAKDAGGLQFSKAFTINVTDSNDRPTAINVANFTIRENISGQAVGKLSATDQDANQTHQFFVTDSRFVIVNGTLELRRDVFLQFALASTVSVDVDAIDSGLPAEGFSQTIVLRVIANAFPWQNPIRSLDADNDSNHSISPLDILIIINLLNGERALLDQFGRLPPTRPADSELPYYDVDGDGFASPLDILLVMFFPHRQSVLSKRIEQLHCTQGIKRFEVFIEQRNVASLLDNVIHNFHGRMTDR